MHAPDGVGSHPRSLQEVCRQDDSRGCTPQPRRARQNGCSEPVGWLSWAEPRMEGPKPACRRPLTGSWAIHDRCYASDMHASALEAAPAGRPPPAAPLPPSHNGTDRLPASCSVCLVLRCLYTRHFKKISYNQARTTSSSLLNKHDTTRKDAGPCSSAASVSTCFVTCRAGEYRWHEKGMVHSWPMWAAAAEGD